MGALFVVWAAASVATVTLVITKSRLFRPVRVWTSARSGFFGKLIGCTLCTSVWVSAAHVALFRPALAFGETGAAAELVGIAALAAVSSVWVWIVFHAHASVPANDDGQGGKS